MKNTFGKGLESLIPKKIGETDELFPKKREAVFSIDIEKVKSNPYQPRKEFDPDGLKSLSDSISDHGILQPLVVSRLENKDSGEVEYQLIAGERRLLAAKMAGLTQVPIVIRQPSEKEKLELSLIENVQRMDLNSIEKAEAFRKLQEEFNFLQKDIARLVGRSREAVANTLRLLDLPEEIKRALREEKISEGHGRAILAVHGALKQKVLFARILTEGLNVREAENSAQKLNVWQPVKKISRELGDDFKKLEERIRESLGIQTLKLGIEAGRPRLTVFFKTKKDIEGLLKKLSPRGRQ